MDNQLILVADADHKNLQILKDNLEASGFMVVNVSNGKDAWEEIQQSSPMLILTEINLPELSGFQLLERIKEDPKTSSVPLIFLTKQREIQQRVRAFELGAKDYLVKPLHVKEVIAHIRMVLRRLEQRKLDKNDNYKKFSGRLNQLSLSDLIENFGVERKTGVLTVSNGRRTGQVFFREGAVINANLGDFKKEQAVYQMFPWDRGYFNMIFRDVDVNDEISISNLGLLLQGIKRLEIRKKLLAQFPSSDTAFTMTENFKKLMSKKKSGDDTLEFVKLLDGKHPVEQIIDESKLDDLVALKRLARLYQQGFIKSTVKKAKPEPAVVESIEPEEKYTFIDKPEKSEPEQSETETTKDQPDKKDADEIIPEKEDTDFETDAVDIDHVHAFTPDDSEIEQTQETIPEKPPERKDIPDEHITTEQEEDTSTIELDEDNVFSLIPPEEDTLYEESETDKAEKKDKEQEFSEELTDSAADESTAEISEESMLNSERTSKQDELEKEIKPLIESIENGNEKAPKEKDKIKEPEPQPEEYESETVEDDDQVYIDEELIQQSATTRRETAEAEQEPESADIISAGNGQDKISDDEHRDKFILISVDDDCKDELMDILTNDNFKTSKIEQADNFQIDFGKIQSEKFSQYSIVALSVEKHLNTFLESIKRDIRGFIFTFDCTRPETWEYTNYLIHSIYDKFKIPYVIAVLNFDEDQTLKQDVIRYKLNLDKEKKMVLWDEADKSSIPELLSSFNNSLHHSGAEESKTHEQITEKATM